MFELSRACLGKMITFIYKWLKRTVFDSPCGVAQRVVSLAEATVYLPTLPRLTCERISETTKQNNATLLFECCFPYVCPVLVK
jgi:hypothetical protein